MDNGRRTPHKQKKYTLRLTLVLAFCGLTLLGGIVLSTVTSMMVGEFIREELRMRLADVVNIMASQIDGDLHKQVQSSNDESGDSYKQLQDKLRNMRDRGTDIAFAYTMRRLPGGETTFVIDSTEEGEDFSHVGDRYEDITETLEAALNAAPGTKKPFVEREPSKDEWGTWLSAFAPIYTSEGLLDGVIGVDVSATNVIGHERQYKITVWIISTAVVLLVLPLGLMFAKRIRQPLAQLAVEMEKVKQFDLDSEVNIRSRIKEIDSMVTQLENMKRGLRSFRKYVPSALVRELIELGVDARLGGTRRELTIFFSDIAEFTTISEKLEPEELVTFLGDYLNIMNASLLQHRATVDKYIGDGVMAFWGAPRPMEDHALHACKAALDCQTSIESLHAKWLSEGLDVDFHTRIGINTGDVIVGNMGSDERMSYTVIGDNVNLTSRLESINKYYGTRILVTESTYQQIQPHMVTRLIDKVVLAGKTVPLTIYELVGYHGQVSLETLTLIDLYHAAFAQYTLRHFTDAAQGFGAICARYPADHASRVLLARCRQLAIQPPADDWRGEFIFEHK